MVLKQKKKNQPQNLACHIYYVAAKKLRYHQDQCTLLHPNLRDAKVEGYRVMTKQIGGTTPHPVSFSASCQ